MLAFGLITDGTPIACRSCNGRLKWPRIGPRFGPAHLDQAARPASASQAGRAASPDRAPEPRIGAKADPYHGPAGFGKTTLLGEWLAGRSDERSVAWASLDEADNDPARFLSYLVAALRTIEDGFGEGILSSLRAPGSPPVEALTGALINELADIPANLAIVLDDYHLIDSDHVHGIVAFLLERLPSNV